MEVLRIEESPGYLIESLSRNMRRYSAAQLRKHNTGLTLEQVAVLSLLKSQGPKFQNELADLMSKDNPTLTRILDVLEKRRLIKRETPPGDRRKFRIILTQEGENRLIQTQPVIDQIRKTLFEGLNRGHLKQLMDLKQLIESNISKTNS